MTKARTHLGRVLSLAPLRAKRLQNATPGKKRGAWWTHPKLAARVAGWARIEGLSVVDLGAGRGALSIAALDAGASRVVSIESAPRLFAQCTRALEKRDDWQAVLGERDGWTGIGGDVFSQALDALRADVAILNPPFEDDLVERFVARALQFAPRAVAIVPVNTLCGTNRGKRLWSEVVQTREARLERRPSFDPGGGNGQRDIIVIEVARRIGPARREAEADLVRVEYWPDRWSRAA